jgi:uncharacterized protein YbjT (DUF2867 family)
MSMLLHLLQSCLVYTLLLQRVLDDPKWANKLTTEDRRALNALFWTHVNHYGSLPGLAVLHEPTAQAGDCVRRRDWWPEAGVPTAFLRAAGFDYNILMWAEEISNGVVRAPYPDTTLPLMHPGDIVACAAAVLLSPTPITGAFSITGPEKLSVRDQTAVLSDVLGTDLRVEQISEDDAVKVGFPEGTPEFVTSSVLGTLGPAATVLQTSGDVQKLTGHAARTFADWALGNAQAFK